MQNVGNFNLINPTEIDGHLVYLISQPEIEIDRVEEYFQLICKRGLRSMALKYKSSAVLLFRELDSILKDSLYSLTLRECQKHSIPKIQQ